MIPFAAATPYIAAALTAAGFASGWWLHGLQYDSQELARLEGQQAALDTVAMKVAQIDVESVTINNKVREVVRENNHYVNCVIDSPGLRLLQQAYGKPDGDGKLSTANRPD